MMPDDTLPFAGLHFTRPRFVLLALFLIAALSFGAYWKTLSNAYVYDDREYIENIPAYEESIAITALFTQDYFTVYKERSYRPVGTLSFYIDALLWKMQPRGAHAFNTVLHILVCWICFACLFVLSKRLSAALFGAALFAVHPVHVEAVALASNREELLCALFYFGALFLFLLWRRKRRNTGAFLVLGTPCFALSMFSKEMAATLPAVMLLCDAVLPPPGENARTAVRRSIPFYATTGLIVAVFLALRYTVFNNPAGGADFPGGSPGQALILMSRVFFRYIKLLGAPWPLCADYIFRADRSTLWQGIPAVAAFAGYLVFSFYLCRRCALAGFAALFFVVTWLPASNIIPFGEIMAERYIYIPSFALAVLGACACAGNRGPRITTAIAALGVIGTLLGLAVAQSATWKDDATLWRNTLRCAPCSAKAHLNLGNVLAREGRFNKALEHYDAASRCGEVAERFKLEYNRGLALLALGRTAAAGQAFHASLNLYPGYIPPYYHLGKIASENGDIDLASSYFRKAIDLDPGNALSYCIAGHQMRFFARNHDQYREAYQLLNRCVTLDPSNANARAELALVLLDVGHRRGALQELRTALSFEPDNPVVLDIFERLGLPPEPAERVEAPLFKPSPWKAWLFITLLFFAIIICVMYVYYLAME